MPSMTNLRDRFNQLKGGRQSLEKEITNLQRVKKRLRGENHYAKKALAVVQECATKTQQSLRYQLCELPKLALQAVFDDPYGFDIDFEIRRGAPEVDFWFVREEEKIQPKSSSGFGSVDIAGMALRPSLWSLQSPRTRPCIILDEPFKHLKGIDANRRALEILGKITKPKEDSNWPGIQIIMIADERAPREDILELSDAVYEFSIRDLQTRTRKLK